MDDDRYIYGGDPNIDPERPVLFARHSTLAQTLRLAGHSVGLALDSKKNWYWASFTESPRGFMVVVDLDLLQMSDDPLKFISHEVQACDDGHNG